MMSRFFYFFQKLVLLVGLIGTSVSASAQDAPLRFGLIAAENADTIRAQWQPLLERLAKNLGRPVEAHVSKDYAGAIWALKEGTDGVSWMGNKAAMEAVDKSDCDIFARKIFDQGVTGYYSQMIVLKDSPLRSLDDVLANAKHLTLGMGDTNSTSGYLIPSYLIFAKRGLEARRHFDRVLQSNHEANTMAVAGGKADAAIVASDHYDLVLKQNPDLADRLKIIWKSPLIPSDPLVMRRDIPAQQKAVIRAFFTELGVVKPGKSMAQVGEEKALLAPLGVIGFAPSDNRQLLPIREIELFRTRLGIEANDSFSAMERQQKLAEVDQKLDDVRRQNFGSGR